MNDRWEKLTGGVMPGDLIFKIEYESILNDIKFGNKNRKYTITKMQNIIENLLEIGINYIKGVVVTDISTSISLPDNRISDNDIVLKNIFFAGREVIFLSSSKNNQLPENDKEYNCDITYTINMDKRLIVDVQKSCDVDEFSYSESAIFLDYISACNAIVSFINFIKEIYLMVGEDDLKIIVYKNPSKNLCVEIDVCRIIYDGTINSLCGIKLNNYEIRIPMNSTLRIFNGDDAKTAYEYIKQLED